jgi:thiosulfate dehydrogenase [quinone] large subunit
VADPKSGDPAIVIHTSGSQFYGYDAVCTHAGCTVQYDPQSKLIVCPCHGAQYDPTHDAQVVAGPAPSPLTKLPFTIDSQGNIYLV